MKMKWRLQTMKKLFATAKVQELFQGLVDSFNTYFNPVEQIKKFALLPKEWSIETGEMTPKMSLKRKVVLEKYKEVF